MNDGDSRRSGAPGARLFRLWSIDVRLDPSVLFNLVPGFPLVTAVLGGRVFSPPWPVLLLWAVFRPGPA